MLFHPGSESCYDAIHIFQDLVITDSYDVYTQMLQRDLALAIVCEVCLIVATSIDFND